MQPTQSHIGFTQASEAQVNALNQPLQELSIQCASAASPSRQLSMLLQRTRRIYDRSFSLMVSNTCQERWLS